MWKKLSLLFVVAIVSIFAVACSSTKEEEKSAEGKKEEKVTITHKLGETELTKKPEKVVAFDFGILDSLDQLGIDVVAVPQATVPPYLEKFAGKKYENVGSLKEPDFEKLSEVSPDLIIISARQAELYEEFSKIAPTVYVELDTTNYMKSFKENMATLGEIFGKEAEVEKEVAKVEDSVKKLNEKASKLEEKALIVLANDGKVSAYGQNSRFGIIHNEFGIKPVDENIEESRHGQSISFEYIAEKNPDYLFVIDRGAVVGGESSAKQVVENDIVKTTNAYKNDNVVYLDANYWYLSGGGLVSTAEMAKEVEEGLK